MLSLAIVGLPNVGKSTLFNALTKSKQADVANYPFCTIEPNVGVVEVPDERLAKLSIVSKSQKTVPTAIEFVDVAGLVKGASEGEGLGNKFLSHIRETDAIVQVVRGFTDKNVVHVHGKVDPKNDSEVINLELIMADWQTVSKRLDKTRKSAKGIQVKELAKELALLEKLAVQLQAGKPARNLEYDSTLGGEDEVKILNDLHLITMKPMLYVINIDETNVGSKKEFDLDGPYIEISAKLEAELAELGDEDAKIYMADLGITETGLDKLVVAGYKLLDLITYFTSGEPETRAWTVKRGTKGPEAAGVIHTDFIKGYIKADVVNWQDFVEYGGWSGIKGTGKLRLEGKEYVVVDGDTVYFHVAT
ncbi:MAG: redox-regulated ATPase YchF [Candidatus Magasanikbacteria bacterium CG_4_10_14_0_8_um_filter_32_14]|uniref:Ribosome-binding ATPase YchF n=2 Tax=Candidatus Magasanikiibacteriota TaxID=1752731 RepID=A0A2M7RA54_9BACT|nr:MAG: redox-regulated ATPase YchF [Candidatus Magasanikbacteria bacterium CG1_02_32_51]PIY93645.1 MAG: redox-regulated ATPase YchF [Candidatus Magasanikbacteria bacterium CG_4_10_14_0_8_um_filter_32_14]